jgi:choline dehydrogenase
MIAIMYDFIVVGAGSAGCVVANRLSADPSHRVLLLEAGCDDRRLEVSIPAAWSKLFKSACDWDYATEPNPGLDGRRLYVPRGKMLGGTSGMNAMIYARGLRADFDEWRAMGNTGWSYDEVLPYFKRSEHNSRGASEYHGAGGPLAVSDFRGRHPLSSAFVESAIAVGMSRTDDFNGNEPEGAGFFQATMRRGRRCSSADAFVRPIQRRRNLTVLTSVHVTRIIFDGRRAVGVAYIRDAREEIARAEREVIVSCGALDSPKLLMLSGIGPTEEIRGHGLQVVHELPGVGQNLQEHPVAAITARCSRPLSMLAAESRVNLLRYFVFRSGMLATNGAEAGAFLRTRADLDAANLEIVFLPVLFQNEGLTPPAEHGFTIAAILLKPASRGHVSLRSADPFAAPLICTNHFSDRQGNDLRAVLEGIKLARRIAAARPLARFGAVEIEPGPHAVSDDEMAAAIRAKAQTVWHPVGTCRMGVDALSVVDPELRVHGVEGLRVIDASVMPTNVRGHPNAAAIMIGEKGADLILRQSNDGTMRVP